MAEGPRKGRSTSLRAQLGWLVATLAIPLLALQGWWAYRDYQGARERAEVDALAFADVTKLGVEQFLAQAEEMVSATADRFGTEPMDSELCLLHATTMTELHPFLTNALVIDADGSVICSVIRELEEADANAWPDFGAFLAEPGFRIADPLLGPVSDIWLLPLLAPIVGPDGTLRGAMVGTVELMELGRLFGSTSVPESHLITVANQDRTVLARSHNADEWLGRPLPPDDGTTRFLAPGRSVATGSDLTGVRRTWGQVAAGPGWLVYAGVPDDVVYGPAIHELLTHMAATLAVILIALLIASRAYKRIGRALLQLADRTAAATRGEPVPLPEGTPSEVTAVVDQFNRTLEARDQAQEAERRALERYQSIFDNAVFGLYASTADGRFLKVNPALVNMLGYDSEDSLIEAGVESLYADPRLRDELIRTSQSSNEVATREVEWIRADGIPITVRLSGKMVRGTTDDLVFEMIVQDITDEKRTEDELRQTQKMEAIGMLAGGVAHDFNNLLTVIGGNVELLEDDLPEDQALRNDLSQIAKATKRAMSLTRRLLTFSRRQRLGEQVLDINEVIPDLRSMFAPLIGEDLSVEARLGPGPIPISMDPGELEQVVLNLVLNARDAMPKGGAIVLETRKGRSKAAGPDAHEEIGAVLAVTDTGIGMDEATQPRIFEPFYTTKPMGEGTGLGLSTVYGIVKGAGGIIHVESEPGIGTRMELWFPLADSDVTEEAPPVLEEPQVGDETVLVVEDDELVRNFVERALRDVGFRVHLTEHGQEAMDFMRFTEETIDLVLTDVVMPEMSGPDLAEQLALFAPDTPVLFMSGYVGSSFLSDELEGRPDLLLRKPFSAAELRSRVRSMIDRAASHEWRPSP